jgi:hypothetical protein
VTDNGRRTGIKALAAVPAAWLMLLFPASTARSEIVLEPLYLPARSPATNPASTPVPSAASRLSLFEEQPKQAKVCKKPKETEPEPFVDHCRALETRLPYLPEIMQKLGWTNGELLMRKWFFESANDDPDNGVPDNEIIKMDWVLGYERAKKVYDQAVSEKVWMNTAAQKVIKSKLNTLNISSQLSVGAKMTFGDVNGRGSLTAAQMQQFNEDYHIQNRPVSSDLVSDPLDDLFAALANFSFNFVVEGTVERLPDVNGKPRYKVTLDKVGIYVRDSYDFNDKKGNWISQPLGYWDCAERDAGKTPGPGAYYVDNDDFREWRDKYGNGKGGDYLVFSDIKVIDVSDSFEF